MEEENNMGDEIYCCVESCQILAEIEVERKGSTLWICGDHFHDFIKPVVTTFKVGQKVLSKHHGVGRVTKVENNYPCIYFPGSRDSCWINPAELTILGGAWLSEENLALVENALLVKACEPCAKKYHEDKPCEDCVVSDVQEMLNKRRSEL